MKEKFDEIIWKCMSSLRSNFAYEDCNKILIYLVFLKYIIDNKKITLNNENFEIFLDAQRMLDKADLDKEIVTNLNYTIENQLSLAKGTLTDFSNLYFKVNELNKSRDTDILIQLNSVNFENQSKDLIDSLKWFLWDNASSFSRIIGDEVSTKALSRLSKELLSIKENESFADFAYGLGLSSLEITEKVKCNITGYEINRQTATMAQMLLIISGNSTFDFYNQDVTTADINADSFDKIATFIPLGIKVKDLDNEQCSLLQEYNLPVKSTNLEVLIALKAIKSLKDNGEIVLTVSPNTLFSATVVEKKFRELIVNNYLSAVISLPSLSYGTSVATTLLVLEKKSNDSIVFIDANAKDFFAVTNKEKRSLNELSDEAILKIKNIIKDKQMITSVSFVCGIEEVAQNDYLLSPSRYVQTIKERETLSNEEIDSQLANLYKEIKKFIQ